MLMSLLEDVESHSRSDRLSFQAKKRTLPLEIAPSINQIDEVIYIKQLKQLSSKPNPPTRVQPLPLNPALLYAPPQTYIH
jgi:hypothetical protein